MLASKHNLKLSGFRGDSHSSHHPMHFMPQSSNNSRASSAKTSSSSLHAMNEDTVADPRPEPSSSLARSSLVRRLSQQLELSFGQSLAPKTNPVNTTADFPVYPDQSYAVLQSQVHPSPYQPFLRGRSSHPSPTENHRPYEHAFTAHGARTVGNTRFLLQVCLQAVVPVHLLPSAPTTKAIHSVLIFTRHIYNHQKSETPFFNVLFDL